ncbi:hypothetical protein Tco_1577177 [Tanacetum coccineum]
MDRNSSIEQFGLGSNKQSSLIDDTESMGDWDAPYQCNTAKGKEMIETKEFIYYQMKTEGKSERKKSYDYPDPDPFHDNLDSSDYPKDEWDDLLENIDFGDIPKIDELPLFVCNMGKNLITSNI